MRALRPRLSCLRATLLAPVVWMFASATSFGAAEAGSLYAPVDLEVIDLDATVAIATKAGEHVPIVLIQDAEMSSVVAGAFESLFEETRGHFLARLEEVFGVRRLDTASVATQEFRDFRADFQSGNTRLPVGPALAQTWARGFDGEPVRERISGLLRAIERDILIGEVRPASSVFVVAPDDARGVRAWGEVAARARVVDRAEILSVAAAGERLRRMNDPLDRSADGYLAGLIRPNVVEDRFLTGLVLRERLGDAAVFRMIPRGTRLTTAGGLVDAWAALALEQLARLRIHPLDAPVSGAATEGPASRPEARGSATAEAHAHFIGSWGWLAGGLLLVAAGVAAVAFVSVRRRSHGALDLAPADAPPSGGAVVSHPARDWLERILRALFTQRSVLLANEQAASRRVAEMEERLARLQPAIADRIRSYEQRIEALEKEIAERDVETRDLLRSKLVLARKELDAEVARSRISWN